MISLLFAFVYLYFFSNIFTIRVYSIDGSDEVRTEIIIKKIKELESKKIVGFLPGNSFFTYHRGMIKDIIFDVLPNTEKVSMYPSSLTTLQIRITAYKPFFKADDEHGITENGTIYKEIQDMSRVPLLKVATTTTLTRSLLQSIADIYPKINRSIFPVTSISVDSNNDVLIRNDTTHSEVRYTYGQDVSTIWSNIVSAIDTEPLKSKLLQEKMNLRYLDARFGNKVFYKFTNENETLIINNHNATSTISTESNH
jgi:hypothetical protein